VVWLSWVVALLLAGIIIAVVVWPPRTPRDGTPPS